MRVIEILVSRAEGERERIERGPHAFHVVRGNPPDLVVGPDRAVSEFQRQSGLADATKTVENHDPRLGGDSGARHADEVTRVFQEFGAAAQSLRGDLQLWNHDRWCRGGDRAGLIRADEDVVLDTRLLRGLLGLIQRV
ncbi:hypothetical protein ACFSTC_56850 [Nonomuraea ferruginea]